MGAKPIWQNCRGQNYCCTISTLEKSLFEEKIHSFAMWSVTTGHQAVTSDVPIFYSRAEHFGCVTVKSIGARNLLNVCFPIWPASYVSFLCFVSFACDQDCLISSSLSVDQRYQQFRPPPMFPQWSCCIERDQK